MADEPRVARLHAVPSAADRTGDESPTADFGSTAGDDGEAGDAAPTAAFGESAAGEVDRAPAADFPGAAGAPGSPAERVARLGSVDTERDGPPPVRVAPLGSAGARRGGDSTDGKEPRRAGRRSAQRDRGGLDRAGPDPHPRDAGSPEVAGGGSSVAPGAPDGGEPTPRERRRPGPKQIDPDADPVVAAKDICLDLLSTRARTKHELADALRRRGVPDAAAATALHRFDEVGLIDDAAFAGQWVRSRQRTRGLARRALAMELRRKGVDDEIAGEALAEVDAPAEEQRARELVDRKLRTVPADTPEQRTVAARRLVGMLARKGYGGGVAYRVVREALAAHGADVDELGSEPAD